ncbi:MAG: hypothetical protein JW839_16610 [Candidatus Lokiarchaeota archaeon]|nr:hypothetical protein [Candidatus Lokiarchaeota archaeon]
MSWITSLVNWVLIPAVIIAAFVILARIFYPDIFRRFVVPAFEGSYDPANDPVQNPLELPVQENVPSLSIDPDTGTYRIGFGEGRSLGNGTVKLHVKGTWYSGHGATGEPAIEFLGQEKSKLQTRLGQAEATTLHWRVPGIDTKLDTTIHEYPGADYMVFEARVPEGIDGLACGSHGEPTIAFPCFENDSPNKRVLCYKNQVFSPAQRDFTFTTSPACFFDDDRNAFVISALDHFITHGVKKDWAGQNQRISCGPNGFLEAVPAGHASSYLLVFGRGINATLLHWGELLRKQHGSVEKGRYADIITSKLGFFTDNGGYYYYNPIKRRFDTTFKAIKAYADKERLPFAYFHLDSFWYPKVVKSWKRTLVNLLHVKLGGGIYGGALAWEPDPYYFSPGTTIAGLSKELGLPFTAHHRWYSAETPYKDRFKFVVEHGWAMSIDPAYWDFIMKYAKESNIVVYEQDWMISHSNHFKAFKAELGFGETWLREMATAAARYGLTIQYCMATPAMWMTGIKFPPVTNARGSNDYHADWPHVYDMTFFTQSSILARALNIWPFKDVFFTTKRGVMWGERCPELEAILSALSAGPVAPGDPIGHVDKRLVRACCRPDGALLKPDRPLTAADAMFTKHAKYYICTTESTRDGKVWHYLLAANLWPKRVKDKAYTLAELDVHGDHVEYDFAKRTARRVSDEDKIELSLKYEQHTLRVYAPVLENGWAVIGDAGRYATMNDKTFSSVKTVQNGVEVVVTLIPNDRINVVVYCPRPPVSVLLDGREILASECNFDAANCLLHAPIEANSERGSKLVVTA